MVEILSSLEKKILRNFLIYRKKYSILDREMQNVNLVHKDFIEDIFMTIYTEVQKNSRGLNINLKGYGNITSIFIAKHILIAISTFDKDDVYEEYFKDKWKTLRNIINRASRLTLKLIVYLSASNQTNEKILSDGVTKKIERIVFSTIENLIAYGNIEEKKVLSNNKTTKFIKHKNEIFSVNEVFFYAEPSEVFIVNNVPYLINCNYISVNEIYRKNIFNPFSEYPNIQQLEFIFNLINLKIYPDIKLINIAVNEILEDVGEDKSWIKDNWWKVESIELLKKIPENFKKSDVKSMDDARRVRFNIKRNIQKKISSFSVYKEIIDFQENFHNYKKGFYLNFFTDFRWRIYSNGETSPTNNKIIRHSINYGEYTLEELNRFEKEIEETKCWKIIMNYEKIIINELKIEKSLKNYELSAIFWCLIEIAKLFKEDMQKDGRIQTLEFLIKGIEWFNKNAVFKKEKKLIYESSKITINGIINGSHWSRTIIFKDATASVIQHLLKILGAKDDLSVKYCNFSDSNNWWDPYYFVLSEYIKKYPNDDLKKFMTREIWKPLILTFHYSVTLHTGITYIMNNLRNNWEFKSLKDEDKTIVEKKMIKEVKNFFQFLNDFFNNDVFFRQNSNLLVENWDENQKFIKTHDMANIYLNYYKPKEKRVNIKNKLDERKTLTYHEIVDVYDSKQTLRALRANIVHASDAQYARLLISKYRILAVHDSFGIDIFRICQFMDDANLLLKIQLTETSFATETVHISSDLYSIFVLL